MGRVNLTRHDPDLPAVGTAAVNDCDGAPELFGSIRRLAMRFAGFVMSAVLGIGMFALGASPASAWTGPSRIISTHSAPLDWCPGNAAICQDSRHLTILAPSTAVTMVCWI